MICIKCKRDGPDGAHCVHCGAKQAAKRNGRRRANGTGSVYRRGSGYQATITFYRSGVRMTRSKGGFSTKKAAYDYLPILIEETVRKIGYRDKVTLATEYEPWSETALLRLSPSKQTAYRIAWDKLASIHNADITELTIADLQKVVDQQAPTYYTARDIKNLLSHLYKRACAEDVVRTNLAEFIVLPTLEEKEASAYTEEEVQKMWAAYREGGTFVGFALIMIYSGMMPGELFACKKTMIDFENQTIIGAGLKTKERRNKPIVIPDFIIPIVREIYDSHNYESLVGMGRDRFYERYHEMSERLGIRDLPPYACRHTTATALALGDVVPPSVITKVMRQKQMTTTERYKHVDDQTRLEALNRLAQSPITRRKEEDEID